MEGGVTISFDNSSKDFILDSLGIKEEREFLIDNKGNLIKNYKNEKIKYSEFGGVLQGSKIFIKNDVDDVLEYIYNQI